MAANHNFDKMAVADNISVNSTVKEPESRDDIDQRHQTGNLKVLNNGSHKKKSTFKITSLTKSGQSSGSGETPADADGDSMDDLDETVESHTEDISSEILDSSRYTDLADTPLEEFNQPFGNDPESKEPKEKPEAIPPTRFKVVKIETKEPFKRGRWLCRDSLDAPAADKSDTKVGIEEGTSGNSSAASSIHYVHGFDEPSKNPLSVVTSQAVEIPPQQNDNIVDNYTKDPLHASHGHGHGIVNTQDNVPVSLHMSGHGQSVWSDGTQMHGNPPGSHLQGVHTGTAFNIPQNLSQTNIHQPQSVLMSTSNASSNITVPPIQNYPIASAVGQISAPLPVISSQPSGQTGTVEPSTHIPSVPPTHLQNAMQQPSADQQSSQQHQIPQLEPQTSGLIPSQPNVDSSNPVLQGAPYSNTQQTGVEASDNRQILDASTSRTIIPPVQSSGDETIVNQNTRVTVPGIDNLSLGVSGSTLLTPSAVAEAVGGVSSPTKEDESGSSTVAIDNKIEQAMDLVKSHLMYAVREEVEVLKEQIKELIEKNNQLEFENSILKTTASPETIAKLSQPRQSQQPPSSSS